MTAEVISIQNGSYVCGAVTLSFTNISGGAAPILASVIGVFPKTWRISASADA